MFLASDSFFPQHFWDFFLMTYALLSRNFDMEIYALFPQIFVTESRLRKLCRFLNISLYSCVILYPELNILKFLSVLKYFFFVSVQIV